MMKKLSLLLVAIFAAGLLSVAALAQEGEDSLPWWNDRVFYEIFVRSFYDSDGDGIGDFRGLTSQLDYLNDGDPTTDTDLGITGIWLMPINDSPSYHGYDVTDYRTINPDYGTMDDFREFLAEAQARGIAVIIDLVVNHSSSQHPWFIDSRSAPDSEYADWYVWADENPGYRGPDGQNVWYRSGDRFYYAVFWSEMPDLNYTNPAVTEEMYAISTFWLEDVGVDGFRLDAIKFITEDGTLQQNTSLTHEWLRGFHSHVRSVNPDALLVGEAWTSTMQIIPYVGDEVDIAFEFDLATGIVRGSTFGINSPVLTALQPVLDLYPEGQYATFLTNHDQDRVMSQLRGDVGAARVAASIYLTLPGVPFIYYGEEIGMVGVKPDEQIRTPMQWDTTPMTAGFTTGRPWRPVNPDSTGVNVANQTGEPNSLLNHYRALVHTRSANPALRRGSMHLVENTVGSLFTFLRHTDEQTLLVVINMRPNPVESYSLTLAEGPLAGVTSATLLFGEGEIAAPEINADGGFTDYVPLPTLPGRSTFIIELGR